MASGERRAEASRAEEQEQGRESMKARRGVDAAADTRTTQLVRNLLVHDEYMASYSYSYENASASGLHRRAECAARREARSAQAQAQAQA